MAKTLFLLIVLALVLGTTESGAAEGRCIEAFDVSNKTIIKTGESVAKGAKFLKAVSAPDRQQCEKLCCQEQFCNIAVFEEKIDSKRDCYLFDCGTLEEFKCSFTVHDHFVSMGLMISRLDLEKTKIHEQSGHEMDLSLMKTKQEMQQNSDTKPQPIGKSKDMQDNRWKNRPDVQVPPSDQDMETADKASSVVFVATPETPSDAQDNMMMKPVMSKEIRKPQSPFTKRPPKTEDEFACSEFQWKCVQSKECIAVYDVCNGVAQCQDRSDESDSLCKMGKNLANQPSTDMSYDPNAGSNGDRQRVGQGSPVQGPIRQDVNDPNYGNNPPQQYQNFAKQSNQYAEYNQNPPRYNPQTDVRRPSQPLNSPPQRPFDSGQNSDGQRLQDPRRQPIYTGGDRSSSNNRYPASGNPSMSSQNRPANPPQQVMSGGGDRPAVVPQQKVPSVSVAKLDAPKPVMSPSSLQGDALEPIHQGGQSLAAVLLSVSMFLLVVLLIFLCCRIRRARKLVRKKGKILNAGEGEYLINGLYL